ncbi:class I SAM-dependent methyltransferase [sulfur-oxidizing endosymbiont of Gigantopelta aegis]|uniref:class I SAM-dependent methyltransferase n=1 Tax=sulfur-oxidizing endosymbiont of Gigantopelta aegis TaxID=2794934 RepID=UPI0018DCECC3|nr:class I SAM-dependent methyltransferase [sulfur-oxidizing endosymbiont of Gigantopelta aegis]
MILKPETIEKTCLEQAIFEQYLSLDNQSILELGCGDARLTRLIALTGENRSVTAAEVDTIQHEKNFQINDLPNVKFIMSGSEKIPVDDNSFDVVFMFKSLHHVPLDKMDQAFAEVSRVLKPSGLVYISEPIFEGEFNEVLRLFHDEERVRQVAFNHIVKAVDEKQFSLVEELFFNTPIVFESFEFYAEKVIAVTHSQHRLSAELYEQVERKFGQFFAVNGGEFKIPIRVDILQNNKGKVV